MARPLRILIPGGWYHVANRSNRRDPLFLEDGDRRRFLELVSELPDRYRVEIHAFVLMNDHYHLLVRTPDANLSDAIRWLQIAYGVWFNRKHDLHGHLFRGRFKAVHIQSDDDIPEVARYLHLNPVRVADLGLGRDDFPPARAPFFDPAEAELVTRRLRTLNQFPWSSWRFHSGREPAPAWLQSEAISHPGPGRNRRDRLAALLEYTEAPAREGWLECPWDRVKGGIILGDGDYVRTLARQTPGNREEQTEARALAKLGRRTWAEIVSLAETASGRKWAETVEKHGDWTRDAVLYVAVRHGGWRLPEILGEIPGLKYQAAAQAIARFSRQLPAHPERRRFVERLQSDLSREFPQS